MHKGQDQVNFVEVYVSPIVCGGSVLVFILCALIYVLSSFAIILTRGRELVALLILFSAV